MSEFYDSSDSGTGWGTPPYIYRPLAESLGGFDLDPASGAEPDPIAESRFTIEDNGLAQEWFGDVWVNPPYSRDDNPKWAMKIARESERERVDSITALVPCSTGTSWFQEHYGMADLLCFIDHRVQFIGSNDDTATFDSVIVCFGEFGSVYVDALRGLGLVCEPCGGGDRQARL